MTFCVSLSTEATQSQVITRQLIQSLEILQFSQDELDSFLRDQAERNPLITLHEANFDSSAKAPTRAGQPLENSPYSSGGDGFSSKRYISGDDIRSLEETCSAKPNLREHLYAQLGLMGLSSEVMELATYLVDSLEPNGYLPRDLEEIADLLDTPLSAVEEALAAVQKLEPMGVGARTLAECLRLQLEERGQLNKPMAALLDNLEFVTHKNVKSLARLCGVAAEDIPTMVAQLRHLDPAPGRAYDWEPLSLAVPDVLIMAAPEGGYRVELNPEALPRVLLDRDYYAELSAAKLAREDKCFIMDCLRSANILVRSLDKRAKTILKIAIEIVRHQEAFFRHGMSEIRPLHQKAVAQALNVHESTVSRAIANKYLLCDHGLISLKFFFSDNFRARKDDDVAAAAIRHKIKLMIAAENPEKPLSDDAIVAALAKQGLSIARRTTTKYRVQLDIPSSFARRQQNRLALARN